MPVDSSPPRQVLPHCGLVLRSNDSRPYARCPRPCEMASGPPDELNELTSALRTVPGVISTAEASAVSLPGGPSPCWPLVTPPPTLGAGVSGYVQDIPLGQNGPCRSRWLSPGVKYSDEQCGTAVFLIQKWLNVGSFIRFRWLLWPLPPSAGDLELIACPACADTCLPPRNLLKRKDGWEPRAD